VGTRPELAGGGRFVAELPGTRPELDVPDFVITVWPALKGVTGDCESTELYVICDKGVFLLCATEEASSDSVAVSIDVRGVDIFCRFPEAGVVFFPDKKYSSPCQYRKIEMHKATNKCELPYDAVSLTVSLTDLHCFVHNRLL